MVGAGLGKVYGQITSVSRPPNSGVPSILTINSRGPLTYLGCGLT